jgi:hypothetical protein
MGYVCRTHGKDEKLYTILLRKLEMKRLLEKLRYRWKDNVNMELREVRCEVGDWIHLYENSVHLVNTVTEFQVP